MREFPFACVTNIANPHGHTLRSSEALRGHAVSESRMCSRNSVAIDIIVRHHGNCKVYMFTSRGSLGNEPRGSLGVRAVRFCSRPCSSNSSSPLPHSSRLVSSRPPTCIALFGLASPCPPWHLIRIWPLNFKLSRAPRLNWT
jgi:hypothetical protein